jgi:type IV pilus assembly protein PilX
MKKNLYVLVARRRTQRGVTMLLTLIALLILLITSVALVRSFDSSLMAAGSIAFKRDLINQADRGIGAAITALTGGALTVTADQTDKNYFATVLSNNNKGIPLVLVNDTTFAAKGLGATNDISTGTDATVRYVIDRQCDPGTTTSSDLTSVCSIYTPSDYSEDARQGGGTGVSQIIYRISVKVTGAHNTQAFVQATVAH